ncbi:hypothetical protein AB1Y20_010629 [Prymnesium parvum]|uniref:SMB domain-containing protein n=1 Tax=Prymnesium parvum TaxID=97485 RepID=A0AB34ITC1_PRYPA
MAASLLFCLSQSNAQLPPPLVRAQAALDGLRAYFVQVERGGSPAPPATGCPCFTCAGEPCPKEECAFCATREGDGCAAYNCFTTAAHACDCNDPTPLPSGAGSAASLFFACGQIGGSAPPAAHAAASQCLCQSDWPFACENCYRWWSAVAAEASIDLALAAKLPPASAAGGRIAALVESMWTHAPYNGRWDASARPTWVDDFAWYALAYLRMFDWTGERKWRERSAEIFWWAKRYGWDTRLAEGGGECGGFFWNLHRDEHYKDSISIVELLHVASRLAASASSATERAEYLEEAEAVWAWLFAFDGGRGLLAENGIMSTGAQPEWCCAATAAASGGGGRCFNSRVAGMSYNHGILLSSAGLLFNLTARPAFRDAAARLLSSAHANLSDSSGAIADVQRGSRSQSLSCNCSRGFDPGTDFFSFKGIFAAHLSYFATTMAASGALSRGMHSQLMSLVQTSSDNAWTRSAAWPPFSTQDRCSPPESSAGFHAAASSAAPPKFHWWWSSEVAPMLTPPDPRLYFTRQGLRCTYSTSIWSGNASLEECQRQCSTRAACATFMHVLNSSVTCFLFPLYNGADREDGAACGYAEGPSPEAYTVGAKRPPGSGQEASCAGRCVNAGSSYTFSVDGSHSCHCDAACTRHMDCCLDYVHTCIAPAKQEPSCESRCVPSAGKRSLSPFQYQNRSLLTPATLAILAMAV